MSNRTKQHTWRVAHKFARTSSKYVLTAWVLGVTSVFLFWSGCEGASNGTGNTPPVPPPGPMVTPAEHPVDIRNVTAGVRTIAFDVENPNTVAVEARIAITPAPPETATITVGEFTLSDLATTLAALPVALTAQGTSGARTENIRFDGLENGTTYTITLTIANTGGEPKVSMENAIPLAPPDMPPDLRAESMQGQVSLSWDAPEAGVDVTEYRIYRAEGMTATPTMRLSASAQITVLSYVDSDVINNTDYGYVVRAVNANGTESADSIIARARPNAHNFVCTNGTPARGVTADENVQRCASCSSGYRLSSNTCVLTRGFSALASGNSNVQSIWSDGTTMWVANADLTGQKKIFAYNMTTKAHDSAKDFDTLVAAGNTTPAGIWSDGTTMWVADTIGRKIYAYNLATKAHDSAKDFNTLVGGGGIRIPWGIWSDGTTMWVVDDTDDKIYAYNMATKARDSAKDFSTLAAAGNGDPRGIWSDGTTMWVADDVDDKLYAYNLATKARDSAKDFDTLAAAGNNSPRGIWSDSTFMWVLDVHDVEIYAYDFTTKVRVQ